MYKFQILEALKTGSFSTRDVRILDTKLDEKERFWIWNLNTLVPHGLNMADTFHNQNRGNRNKRD